MMVEDWTYQDFLTYLMILGAKADLKISEDERDHIIAKVGEEEFNKVKRVFDKQNDAQHIDTVSKLYYQFQSQIGGKENLINQLKEIINTGEREENVLDQELLMMLKRIL